MTTKDYEPPLVPAVLLMEAPLGQTPLGAQGVSTHSITPEATAPTATMIGISEPLNPLPVSAAPPQNFTVTTTSYTIAPKQNECPVVHLGRSPCPVHCPNCHCEVYTKPYSRVNATTVCAIVTLFIVFWPIAWLPLCMSDCQTTEHYCSQCNHFIGQKESCE